MCAFLLGTALGCQIPPSIPVANEGLGHDPWSPKKIIRHPGGDGVGGATSQYMEKI